MWTRDETETRSLTLSGTPGKGQDDPVDEREVGTAQAPDDSVCGSESR